MDDPTVGWETFDRVGPPLETEVDGITTEVLTGVVETPMKIVGFAGVGMIIVRAGMETDMLETLGPGANTPIFFQIVL